MSALLSDLKRRLSAEQGLTLVEIVVALTVLTVGILGMVMGVNASRRLLLVSERHATMAHIAQKEIERVEGIAYSKLGLTSTPAHSTDPTNPDYFVAAGPPPTFQWDRTNSLPEPIDVDSAQGTIAPVQSWNEGLLSGQIYDFVTWGTDAKCSPGCPSSENYKRVTVAVTMSGGLQPNPIYVSSVVADPQAAPAGGISNGSGGNPLANPTTTCTDGSGNVVSCSSPINSGNPNDYFLHDWPAPTGGGPQPPTGDHPVHSTVGITTGLVCTTSQVLGTILSNITGCPVPDLMDANPPPSDNGGTPPPLYNYSNDLCPDTCYPGGRVLQPTCLDSSGCGHASPSDCGSGNWASNLLNAQSELWVTSPVSATTTLTGDGGISMFTQMLGGLQAIVTFCIEIYDVPPSGSAGSLSDILAWPPVALGGAGYVAQTDPATGGNWPSAASQLSFIFNFRGSQGAVSIAAGHRLGVRIWMKANANASINVIYDNPLYPAQVQLNTQ